MVHIRKETMALVREEMKKVRPRPSRNSMIEVLVEDGLKFRGLEAQMPWLNEEASEADEDYLSDEAGASEAG